MSTAYKANGKVHSMTLDVDGSGYIKGVALRTGLTAMGETLSTEKIDKLISKWDCYRDMRLHYKK